MKKLFMIATLALAATTVTAAEVGIRGVHTASSSPDMVGLTLNDKFSSVGVQAAFDRSTRGAGTVNRWSLLAEQDLFKVNTLTITAKGGLVHVDPSFGKSGTGVALGVSATHPLSKTLSLVAEYQHQRGEKTVTKYDGNMVSLGMKVKF
jgi:outer membrane autotransporter protein